MHKTCKWCKREEEVQGGSFLKWGTYLRSWHTVALCKCFLGNWDEQWNKRAMFQESGRKGLHCSREFRIRTHHGCSQLPSILLFIPENPLWDITHYPFYRLGNRILGKFSKFTRTLKGCAVKSQIEDPSSIVRDKNKGRIKKCGICKLGFGRYFLYVTSF